MSCPCACSRDATCSMRTPASPTTRPPSLDAISPRGIGPAMSARGRLALERLDHPVGDVDPRVRVDGVLEDDVVLLLLGDLADDAIRLLHDLRQLLVAALVEVLAELALAALEVAAQVVELAFLRPALAVRQGDALPLELVLHALQLLRGLGQLLVALGEFRLDLLLRAHRRHRVAQDAGRIDEADAAFR